MVGNPVGRFFVGIITHSSEISVIILEKFTKDLLYVQSPKTLLVIDTKIRELLSDEMNTKRSKI